VEMRALVWQDELGTNYEVEEIPAELLEQAQEYHHQLIDSVADHDDELLETYLLDEDAVTPEMLKRALRAATLDITVTPILAGDRVLNTTTGKTERVGRILQMHANHREEREQIMAGEIAATVGLKNTTTGDTLATDTAPIRLESMDFPEPVISVAIEPKTKGDQDKLGGGLQRLAEEDPTFRVRSDEETGQTLISGMGELHLEIIVDRLTREFSVDANVGRPQVAYRETVSKPVEKIEGRFVRQTGGRGQYGHAVINPEPMDPGDGYDFVDKIAGGKIPKEYIPSVDLGIQEAMESGVMSGYPVVDVRVELVDGSYHDVDSSEMAFKIAGSMAFKNAAQRAKPKLLEPVMAVEVVTPEEYLGDVM